MTTVLPGTYNSDIHVQKRRRTWYSFLVLELLLVATHCWNFSPRYVSPAFSRSAPPSVRSDEASPSVQPSERLPGHWVGPRRPVLDNIFRAVSVTVITTPWSWASSPERCEAGEIGARITQAVTQSELGVTVRQSVVRGAQTMDRWDQQWEQFSDRFRLGSERSQRPNKPAPRVYPDRLPLESQLAQQILDLTDTTFCQLTRIKSADLRQQINLVMTTVRPAFERSGLPRMTEADESSLVTLPAAFNFAIYTHFKAYSNLLLRLDSKVDFRTFRSQFEAQVGQQLVKILLPSTFSGAQVGTQSAESWAGVELRAELERRWQLLDALGRQLVERGLVAAVDRTSVDEDALLDWLDGIADLTFSVVLGGDITTNAQILLQEQGFLLYPNLARFSVAAILRDFPGQDLVMDDYYLDTDYSSDPNQFEVKEVLINIILQAR